MNEVERAIRTSLADTFGRPIASQPVRSAGDPDLLADGDPRLVEAAAQFRKSNPELRRLDES